MMIQGLSPFSYNTNYGGYYAVPGYMQAARYATPGYAQAAGSNSSSTEQTFDDSKKVKSGYRSSPAECQTCRERKYQDGSNETDVSFKAPGHISPQASASTVRAHEQQHVSNAYQKAAQKGGDVVSCNVTLRTAICPECGTSYVSGGTTNTMISYPGDENANGRGLDNVDMNNPYQKNQRALDAMRLIGSNIDYAA